ncbi:MAG: multiheme c-type cytochrome [Calditrichota bacterium]
MMELSTDHMTAVREWRHKLLFTIAGLLVFETLSGLSLYLLPFSISNQIMVLLHTIIGLIFIIPFGWYQLRHWLLYRPKVMTHFKLTGYFSLGATLMVLITGILLTLQAIFGTRIGYLWDTLHIITTFALIAALAPHIGLLVYRNHRAKKQEALQPVITAERTFGINSLVISAVLLVLVALLAYAYEPVRLNNNLPDDYSYLYGQDRPFAPSLATTTTGGAFDARSLGGSEGCGTSGCHEEILKEWQTSAHRYSAMDPAFQAVQKTMGQQNGPESTRYCGGCHDPISLFSGTKNLFREDLTSLTGYQEGVSCIVCHAIKKTDVKGNANYVLDQPVRYLFELYNGQKGRFVRDFLIRAYPKHHVASLSHRMFKSPEFCAACHKQFIDKEINNVGWVQLQNQYDNWRKSRWNHPGDPNTTIECRECHMPLMDTFDPASGDPMDYNRSPHDGKHRSHRFLAANQFVPELLDLPGARDHTTLTEQWLQGKIEIPEIADKWRPGPAIPIELIAPAAASPGRNLNLQVNILNNKPGHDFPTGPMDIIQAWLEIIVSDQDGNQLFTSGTVDGRHFIKPGSFILKAEAVDQRGNLIDRHNLWELVGVRYSRALFPGFSDKADYSIRIPNRSVTEIHVRVRLLYRKIEQNLINFLFGEDAGITAPVTVISEDQATIPVQAG